jgi:RNA polymerase sigma factor (sigma-70 family)
MRRTLLQQLFRRMYAGGGSPSVSDDALLDDYRVRGDQKAFELLVWRHAAMVLETCRRILRGPHDAEDAFQAVFWILARKAGTIRRREALPSWLHRVAVRVALAAKERRRPMVALEKIDEPASAAIERDPILDRLDEEIARLPAKYRLPIILCHLEEKSSAAAAEELGIPQGTLFSRLARGRAKLRTRLERRGVGLGIAAAAILEQNLQAAPTIATPLVETTLTGALAFAARHPVESATVLTLVKGVLHAMFLRKITVWSASILVTASLVTGAWFALQPAAAQVQPPAVAQQAPKDNKMQKLLKERYESAEKAFRANNERYVVGKESMPVWAYQWSLKMLEAELDWKPNERVRAHTSHLERMQRLNETEKNRLEVGVFGPTVYGVSEHGVLEAELWLEREKAKK